MSNVVHLPRVIRLVAPDLSALAPLRLVPAGGDAPLPDGWTRGTREPCAAGHGDGEECDLCRAECIGGPGRS